MTRPDSVVSQKAGLFIYGYDSSDVARGNQMVIAPYSEGRFGKHDKAYVLPKGSVDEGEHPVITAMREGAEETGFDVLDFLGGKGSRHVADLIAGKTLQNITNPNYPGVTLVRFGAAPVDHTYQWHGTVPNHFLCYGVEIDGIEKLKPRLKNQANGNGLGHVGVDVEERTRDRSIYPGFEDMLTWLRTSQMPSALWNDGTALPALCDENGKPFGHHIPARIHTPKQLRDFADRLQETDPEQNKCFRNAIKAMKVELEKRGILKGDKGEIKLDEKDSPLTYYQEGAELLSASNYLTYCIERMRANKQFAQAFGSAKQEYLSPRDYLANSQLIACAPFLRSDVIMLAEARIEVGMRAAIPSWEKRAKPAPLEIQPLFKHKTAEYQGKSWASREEELRALPASAVPALG